MIITVVPLIILVDSIHSVFKLKTNGFNRAVTVEISRAPSNDRLDHYNINTFDVKEVQ